MADFCQSETENADRTRRQKAGFAFDLRLTGRQRPEERLPKAPTADGNTFLYVVQSLDCVKVGHAKNLYIRVSNLRVDNPHDVQLLRYIEIERRAALIAESWVHFQLAERCVSGEWFRASPKEVLEIVERTIAAKHKYPAFKRLPAWMLDEIVAEERARTEP